MSRAYTPSNSTTTLTFKKFSRKVLGTLITTSWSSTLFRELLHQANNLFTLLFDFLERLLNHQQLISTMLLWLLWRVKTQSFKSLPIHQPLISLLEKDTLHEWICMQRAKPKVQNSNHLISWVKLPIRVLKCNVDAATFHNNTISR